MGHNDYTTPPTQHIHVHVACMQKGKKLELAFREKWSNGAAQLHWRTFLNALQSMATVLSSASN